jgi:hypothetical protein
MRQPSIQARPAQAGGTCDPNRHPTAVKLERTCKPGSVPAAPWGGRPATISLRPWLPTASSGLPGRWYGTGRSASSVAGRTPSCLTLLRVGFAEPGRSPGLLVSSYLTVSPLPSESPPTAVCFLLHFPWPRGRWALPTTLALLSPDFPPAALPQPAVARSAPVTAQPILLQAKPLGWVWPRRVRPAGQRHAPRLLDPFRSATYLQKR